ncbi:MAG: PP2C family protein-serine/threonine phosphatase [Isosphaeraceae bacterium]
MVHHIKCSEVWGGISDHDGEVSTCGVTASLHSKAADGGKGGDIYYVSVCSTDKLTRIALADVMGHGRAVSRTSQWLYEGLHAHMNDTEGNGILARLNELAGEESEKAITTAAVVAFYLNDGHLYFANAGHPPVLVRRRSVGKWEKAALDEKSDPGNLPLGILPDVGYDQQREPFSTGDRIFLYTDGVLEAPDPKGNLFGLDRLVSTLEATGERSLPEVKAAVLEALRAHTGGPLDHDDITFIAVEVS